MDLLPVSSCIRRWWVQWLLFCLRRRNASSVVGRAFGSALASSGLPRGNMEDGQFVA